MFPASMIRAENERFGVFMWIVAVWMAITWFFPTMAINMLTLAWPYHTSSLNMDLKHYYNVSAGMDAAFVFLIVITVLMLVIAGGISAFNVYLTVKRARGPKAQKDKASSMKMTARKLPLKDRLAETMHKPVVRTMIVLLILVAMFLVSVASILHVTCFGYEEIHDMAIMAKYPPYKSNAKVLHFAKLGYEMAHGGPPASDSTSSGVHYFLPAHVPLLATDMSNYMMMTRAQLDEMVARGDLYMDNVLATSGDVTNVVLRNRLYMYSESGGRLTLSMPVYPEPWSVDKTWTDAFLMARSRFDAHDVHDMGFARIARNANVTMTGNYTTTQLMASPEYQAGLAAAVLSVAHSSMRHVSTGLGSDPHILHVGSTNEQLHVCRSRMSYADFIFFASFVAVGILLTFRFFVYQLPIVMKMCRKVKSDNSDDESEDADITEYSQLNFNTLTEMG